MGRIGGTAQGGKSARQTERHRYPCEKSFFGNGRVWCT